MNSFKHVAGWMVLLAATHGGQAPAVEVKPKAPVTGDAAVTGVWQPEGDWRPVKTDVKRGIRTWARLEDDKPWRSFKV
jgi:hypothetical protein